MSASGGEEGSEEEIRVMSVKEVWYTNKAVLLAVALLVPVRINRWHEQYIVSVKLRILK